MRQFRQKLIKNQPNILLLADSSINKIKYLL